MGGYKRGWRHTGAVDRRFERRIDAWRTSNCASLSIKAFHTNNSRYLEMNQTFETQCFHWTQTNMIHTNTDTHSHLQTQIHIRTHKHRHARTTQCLPKSWFLERSRAWNLVIPFEVMFSRFSFSSVLKKDPLILPIWWKNWIDQRKNRDPCFDYMRPWIIRELL